MSLGGEELGTITFRVVDAGSSAAPSQSPGGAMARKMPSQDAPQKTIVEVRGGQPRTVSSSGGGGFNAAGISSIIAQSTTNPYGAAVGAASLAGGATAAAPLLLIGASVAAAVGAVYALRSSISALTARMQDIGRFGPGTMQAMVAERVAAFNRQIYRSQAGDAEFSAFQRQLTALQNRLTPIESLAERKGAQAVTFLLEKMEKGIVNTAVGVSALSILATAGNDKLAGIGQSVQNLANQIINANGGPADVNALMKQQIDTMTGGSVFGTLGPIPPVP